MTAARGGRHLACLRTEIDVGGRAFIAGKVTADGTFHGLWRGAAWEVPAYEPPEGEALDDRLRAGQARARASFTANPPSTVANR